VVEIAAGYDVDSVTRDTARDATGATLREPDDEKTVVRALEMPPEALRPPRSARGSTRTGATPRRVGKYELRDKIGRGAFGVVYTARDPSLERDVAIKVLRPTHLTNHGIVQRFLQEARATARVAHPGIVTIHDCGQIETNLGITAFIAMELLAGESLTLRLARCGRLEPEVACEIARQVASALDAAHHADVLHRDLKPDNIYLVPDPAMPSGERVKVLDFGLAKIGHEGHTQLEKVFGTPRYMSPEQCRSAAQVDPRSDIYALGCILFELVTGRVPFDGDVRALIEAHQHELPPRAAQLVADVPAALDQLIAAMLAKEPAARPQTMTAIQGACAAIATAPPLTTTPFVRALTTSPPVAAPAEPPPAREPRRATALSGEVLVPAAAAARPTAPRPSAPARPWPRSRTLRLVALGALIIAASVVLALVTAT
jgi:serine/threonine-protein kinase